MELFKAKVRQVGTSLGILLPKSIIKEGHISKGEHIEVSILKERDKEIKKFFGSAKGTSKFKRDNTDREERFESVVR